MSKRVRRLSQQFLPEHYDLQLTIDNKAKGFKGVVAITGRKVGRPSQRLTFHQNGLRITSAKIVREERGSNKEYGVDRINAHNRFDEVRVHCKQLLYPGTYKVLLEFKGTLTRQMNGIYPSYFKHAGSEKMLIATQFESHHAREAFPCIDEPEAKATFDLTLTTPKVQAVIANTPIKQQEVTKHTMVTRFETTPKMSSYLLAFAYGELEHLEAHTNKGITIRTYATPDNIAHTKFALDVAVKCLEFFNDYFGIDYPLPKCDLIALPDFAAGAMENWGCITFREQALLVDSKNTSLSVKQYVAMVVAHELAHQWFGDLVTMRWWSDLWLNEGFASWIEYLAVDHLFPDWQMWTQFITDEQEQAFKLDALEYTHPIEVPINHPDEIRTIFDAISYSKGSSAIHMLHKYLGSEIFREGLRHYLQKHAYGNTDTVDLWAALESVSHKPVKQFMHAWTSQPGFPLVHVVQKNSDSAKPSEVTLKFAQRRFFLNPKADRSKGPREIWPIPIHGNRELADVVLNKPEEDYILREPGKYYLCNHGRGGFYRVAYDPAYLRVLTDVVKAGKLSPIDRLGLLSDSFETVKAGHIRTTEALNLLEAYINEDNNVVWDIIASMLGNIRGVMNDEPLREAMKPYIRNLTAKQLKRLGWKPHKSEPYFDSLLRPTILGMAAVADEPNIVKEAMKRFNAIKQSEDIEPDLRGIIYGTVARNGAEPEFNKLLTLHNQSRSGEERVILSAALTGFKHTVLIKRALALIDSDVVRLQDVAYWVAYSFMNPHAKQLTWRWMTSHWAWLEKNLGSDLSFYRFPVYAARAFSDSKFLPVYKKFFAAHLNPTLERPVKQGAETIEWQSAWRSRDLNILKDHFKV